MAGPGAVARRLSFKPINFTAMNTLPKHVKIVEVGPRDGLQNEPRPLPAAVKCALITQLADAGIRFIEAGSFVNPKWVPQMADSDVVFAELPRRPGVTYSALTPNLRGFERAVAAGVDEVAIFAAASETFSHRNINCSIADSLKRFDEVVTAAASAGVPVRGYISCVAGCPYEGDVDADVVANLSRTLLDMGCYEVSLGDTIGVGTAGQIQRLIERVGKATGLDQLAVHFHDTYGQALANIFAALQCGVGVIDSSVAGLGGCPYAKGATGNVATEDVIYLLNGLGIETGIDLASLVAAGNAISAHLGRPNQSRAACALS